MEEYTLFIFRRDLRLIDNVGLIYADTRYENIIPIFIFTPEQNENNERKSNNAVQFMIESLKDLDDNLRENKSKLHLFHGDNIDILKQITKKINVKNIVFNMDYTLYAIERDKKIKEFCDENDIKFVMTEDYLLKKIGTILKNGECYKSYTSFKINFLKQTIPDVKQTYYTNLIKKKDIGEYGYIEYNENKNILVHGGRMNGLEKLNNYEKFKTYNKTKNMLDEETTQISAYIKFGCISIREVYWKIRDLLGTKNDLINQIIWREFYYYVAYYNQEVFRSRNYNDKYDTIKWEEFNEDNYRKWKNGMTGFPIVDAGMRQLKITGYMHNRARLICGNFLIKMMRYDWRYGEKHFCKYLIDYDPSVNNGNWQWVASTGVDNKSPTEKIYNPWLQGRKYDPNALYIKKWVKELSNVPSDDIHSLDTKHNEYNIGYPIPMLDYKTAKNKCCQMYKDL